MFSAVADYFIAQAIGRAKVDVSPSALRELLGPEARHLDRLVADGSERAVASALELAAELPVWSQKLEQAVAARTADPSPPLRELAYRALATRDLERSHAAWLVYDAVFDPDARVRAVAR